MFLITLDQGHIYTVEYQIARKDKYETGGNEDDARPDGTEQMQCMSIMKQVNPVDVEGWG